MMYNENQKNRTIKYLKTLREIRFRVKPEEYERWENAAKQAGFASMRQFYIYCIDKAADEIESKLQQ